MLDQTNAALYSEVKAHVDSVAANVSPARRVQMANALTDFVIGAAAKYAKGEEEHSDSDITTCDLKREINAEIMDLFWYNTADKNWK